MRFVTAFALAVFAGTPALAQQASRDGSLSVADEISRCRSITGDADRLACFDRASASLAQAQEAGEVVVLNREDVRRAKRQVFGFSLPNINLFGNGRDARAEPEVREIESTVTRVSPAGNGLHVLTLADNSQWQTIEARTGFFPREGRAIKIEAGILGSYSASIAGGRGFRVKRVR